MPDREAVMTAIRRVTEATELGTGNSHPSKTQKKREAASMRALFKAIGLDKPSKEDIYRCYPWC